MKAEVAEFLAKAEAADKADVPDELARRERRLKQIAEAKAKIKARVKERYEREKTEHEAKLAAREANQKPGSIPFAPPVEGPQPGDQVNLTDEELRIMPVSGGGFEQFVALLRRGPKGGGHHDPYDFACCSKYRASHSLLTVSRWRTSAGRRTVSGCDLSISSSRISLCSSVRGFTIISS